MIDWPASAVIDRCASCSQVPTMLPVVMPAEEDLRRWCRVGARRQQDLERRRGRAAAGPATGGHRRQHRRRMAGHLDGLDVLRVLGSRFGAGTAPLWHWSHVLKMRARDRPNQVRSAFRPGTIVPRAAGSGCAGLVIEGLWTLVSTADPNEAPGGASAPVGGRAVVRGDRPDDERLRASAVAASTSTASVRRRQAGRRALSDRLAAGAAW